MNNVVLEFYDDVCSTYAKTHWNDVSITYAL